MKNLRLFCFLILQSCLAHASQMTCPEFPHFKPQSGPLAHLNCAMHQAYEKRVKQIMSTFGSPNGRPIILNLGNQLILKYKGGRTTLNLNPKSYHELKAFCHGSLAVFLILSQQKEGVLNEDTTKALEQLRNHFKQSKSIISTLSLAKSTKMIIQKLYATTDLYLQSTLKTKRWVSIDLQTYYKKSRPLIDQLVKAASLIELQRLNTAINAWLKPMTAEERKKIGIAITTVHQARANELSVQYFMKKFNKQVGIGALKEKGMVVVENNFDENAVLKQLARNYLDREAGQIIFSNPERLQEDILSKGTSLWLNLKSID